MDIMKTINQAISVITNPKQALQNIKNEKMEMMDIIMYLAIVGIPILIGYTIGFGAIGYNSAYIGSAIAGAIAYYIMAIIGIIVFGFLINAFAPSFKSKQNKMNAMKLVAFSATPWLLAGIFYILPAISLIALVAGLYGLYILYIGIPIFMETPKDQHMIYLIVAIVIFIIVIGVVATIANQIWWNLYWGSINPYRGPFF